MDDRALNLRGESSAALRAVTVHGAAHAAWARATAESIATPLLATGHRLALLSAPAAALYLSPALFLTLTGWPDGTALPILDCGEAPGHALAALRAGCPALILAPSCAAYPAVAAAAEEAGAMLLPARPPTLDLALLRPGDPWSESRLRDWLAGLP